MRVVLFGLGILGKKVVEEVLKYSKNITIIAICDNNSDESEYMGIPIISPDNIIESEYDELWISTVYFISIIDQLESLKISRNKIFFVEPVSIILDERIRNRIGVGKTETLFDGEKDPEIIEYLRNHKLGMYPYSFYDEYLYMKSSIWFDEKAQLYYGVYNGRRMYIAKRYDTEEKARLYFNMLVMEQDLRSPHCYLNDSYELHGNVIDVGAAEGIYGLRIIDKISHLYMIEADPEWVEALHYTYCGYEDKISIISEFVGDGTNSKKLDDLFEGTPIDSIKMDIEGAEISALKGADMLVRQYMPYLAICVYHHREDNRIISTWLEERGYSIKTSDGYVVCIGDWELDRDEVGFRKALLFAKRRE